MILSDEHYDALLKENKRIMKKEIKNHKPDIKPLKAPNSENVRYGDGILDKDKTGSSSGEIKPLQEQIKKEIREAEIINRARESLKKL